MNELDALNINQVFDIARSIGIPVGDYDNQTGNFIGSSTMDTTIKEPNFPTSIVNVSDPALGELLHVQSEWIGHLEERLSEYTAQLRIYKEQKERIEKKLLVDSGQAKVTVRKAEARISPEFLAVNGRISIIEAIIDIIQAAVNKSARRITSLSRQISLRANQTFTPPYIPQQPTTIPTVPTKLIVTGSIIDKNGRKSVRA